MKDEKEISDEQLKNASGGWCSNGNPWGTGTQTNWFEVGEDEKDQSLNAAKPTQDPKLDI